MTDYLKPPVFRVGGVDSGLAGVAGGAAELVWRAKFVDLLVSLFRTDLWFREIEFFVKTGLLGDDLKRFTTFGAGQSVLCGFGCFIVPHKFGF